MGAFLKPIKKKTTEGTPIEVRSLIWPRVQRDGATPVFLIVIQRTAFELIVDSACVRGPQTTTHVHTALALAAPFLCAACTHGHEPFVSQPYHTLSTRSFSPPRPPSANTQRHAHSLLAARSPTFTRRARENSHPNPVPCTRVPNSSPTPCLASVVLSLPCAFSFITRACSSASPSSLSPPYPAMPGAAGLCSDDCVNPMNACASRYMYRPDPGRPPTTCTCPLRQVSVPRQHQAVR